MEWQDEGLALGTRRHGETSVILELMTRHHGRHMGMVRGGRSRRMQPVLQAGNGMQAVWRARIDEHMGAYVVEGTRLRAAAIMQSEAALHGMALVGVLLRLLPEREAHPGLYETALLIADNLHENEIAPALMVRFELALLQQLGFGLDLTECAVTRRTDDLVYVSPRSGRAVCAQAGAAWHDRLLPLPAFLRGDAVPLTPGPADIAAGFRLTGFFLTRDVFAPRGGILPDARRCYVGLTSAA